MQYLTPSEIKKVAPAITRLPRGEGNLIDTTKFLGHMDELGFKPIIAVQGTPHSDADTKKVGRHLAVAANRSGQIVALLNSHTVWRRAWLGYGHLLSGGSESDPATFLIGAVLPIQRWRGYQEPLDALFAYQSGLADAFHEFGVWHPDIPQSRWMAKKMASTAYLEGHKTPLAKELRFAGADGTTRGASGQAVLHYMLRQVFKGGLLPDHEPVAAMRPRKLKPVASPDAMFKASNAAFRVGIAAVAKYRESFYAFPAFGHTQDGR